jgi:serine/threonine protein kinase/tetratricopeptide (TPR) repeat protein
VATSEPRTPKKGELIADRYTVLGELGRGGMAAVFRCRDSVTNEDVAIKVLFFESQQQTAKYAVWFHQEARALAALDHPSVVRARDFGTMPDGAPYLVMDALEGRSIHAWKHALGALPWPVIWSVMDQVLAGLAHVHARRIIHGDLKPSNIMIDPRDGQEPLRTYILDLGLAWLLTDHIDPRLVGMQMEAPAMPLGGGTPGWLAPEQIRHATPHVGPATDLYALGCILFELLSDREVFEGTSEQILKAHRDTPAPLPQLKEGVPAAVGPFTQKLLAKRPWHRYRFAADARAEWQHFAPPGPFLWTPTVPLRSRVSGARSPVKTPPRQSAEGETKHLAPGIIGLRPCPLVGRERERAGLLEQVEATLHGESHHRLVVLEGDAGVGKSRLAEWLCEHVHEHGQMLPLRAKYQAFPSPLDGLRGAILTQYNLVGQSREIIEAALLNEWEVGKQDDDGRTWVAAAAQWLRPPAPDEPAELGPAGKRFMVDQPEIGRAIVRHALGKVSQGRPLAIWLDDLHLAPATTFEGLAFLHHDLPGMRFLLLATARAEALAADRAATERIEALCRVLPSTRSRVAPLSPEQTRKLLQNTLPLAPEAEQIAVDRSQGNPLFALQLVHAWAGGGFFTLQHGLYAVAPDALQGRAVTTAELWEERLGSIPGRYRQAADAAAALGADIPRDALAQLLAALWSDQAMVEPGIEALEQAQILFSERGNRLRWAHALLHEHTLARLQDSPAAPRLFRLAADALLFHPDAGTERVVRHRAQNLIYAGEIALASDLLFHFIEATWSRLRDGAAVRLALGLLDGKLSGRGQAVARRWKAEVERLAGNLAGARAEALAAERSLSVLGDPENQAHCQRLLGQIACDEGRPAAGRPLVEQAYAKFLELGHDVGRAECEFVLGQIEALLGRHESASERLTHAAQGFRAAGEALGLGQCLMVQARAEMAAGRRQATMKLLKEARAEFDELGYALGLAQVDLALAQAAHGENHHAEALRQALLTKARFEALGSKRGRTDSARIAAIAAFDLGRLEQAEQLATEAYGLATEEARLDLWGKVEACAVLAQVAIVQNKPGDAAKWLLIASAAPLDDAEPLQHRELTAAWLHLSEKRHVEAVTALARARRAFTDARRTGDHTPQILVKMAEQARSTPVEAPLQIWLAALKSRRSTPPPAMG